MNDTYYIQSQARRILKCIYSESLPKGRVFTDYLHGIDEKSFWKAYGVLHGIYTDYYSRAEKDPHSMNLPIYEIEKYRSTSKEAREGNAALLNFPGALLALGVCSQFSDESQKSIITDIKNFKKYSAEIKVKYLPKQLNLLLGYGFTIDNFDGKRLPTSGMLCIEYPDNSDLLIVLLAMGDKFSKYRHAYLSQPKTCYGLSLSEQFIFLIPAIFTDSSEKLAPKSLEHMVNAVGKDKGRILYKITEEFSNRGLTLQFDTGFVKNRLVDQKGRDSLSYVEYGDYRNIWGGDEQLYLRLKLNNIDAYIDRIEALPPHIYKSFTDIWCANCAEKCNRRIIYHLHGEEKRACGCFFFAYENPNEDDVDILMELYDLEQKARTK